MDQTDELPVINEATASEAACCECDCEPCPPDCC